MLGRNVMKKLILATVIFVGGYFLVKKSYRVYKDLTDWDDLDIKWDVT